MAERRGWADVLIEFKWVIAGGLVLASLTLGYLDIWVFERFADSVVSVLAAVTQQVVP